MASTRPAVTASSANSALLHRDSGTPLVATWTTVASVSGNADSVTAHPVAAVTARYVRLSVAAGTQTGEPVSRIYEIEVYGT
jgi:hypothetical protein